MAKITIKGDTSGEVDIVVPAEAGSTTYNLSTSGGNVLSDNDIGTTVQGYDATILKSANIGSTVQGYDADTAKYDDATANFTGTLQNGGVNVLNANSTLSSSNLSGALPAIDGSALTNLPAGGFSNILAYTNSSTLDVTSIDRVKVTVTGGGGGAGGSGDGGSSGGAGGTSIEIINLSGVTGNITITVGAGGAGSTSGTGGTGGTSSFGAYCSATGGTGGGSNGADGGTGGSATGGHINIPGGDGFSTVYAASLQHGGTGGASYWGGGGKGRSWYSPSQVGQAGKAYGSGGGAGLQSSAGGAGRKGIVVVEY